MFSRFSKLPSRFVEDYELMLVVMTILQSDMRRGSKDDPNCQVATRALAEFFPDFRVADGYMPRLAQDTFSDQHGARAKLRVQGAKNSFHMRFKQLIHSWLVWRDTNLVVDVWPVGGVKGFNPPVARLQDGYDVIFVEAVLPNVFPVDLDKRVKDFRARVKSTLENISPDMQKAA